MMYVHTFVSRYLSGLSVYICYRSVLELKQIFKYSEYYSFYYQLDTKNRQLIICLLFEGVFTAQITVILTRF